MSTDICLVLCTCPDVDLAERLARELVENRLAACVNLLPGVRSFYVWEGRLEKADECQLIIKSDVSRFPDLESFIKSRHPYDTPEIIALPVLDGSEKYLSWITSWVVSRS